MIYTDINIAVGVMLYQKSWTTGWQALIARRSGQRDFAGYWEFPGGKVEGQESPLQAIRREWQEELGVELEHRNPRRLPIDLVVPVRDKLIGVHAFLIDGDEDYIPEPRDSHDGVKYAPLGEKLADATPIHRWVTAAILEHLA